MIPDAIIDAPRVQAAALPKDLRKLAIVTWFPDDPCAPRGGVEAVSVSLVEALAASSDLEIHVVTLTRGVSAPTTKAWGRTTVHRLPWSGRFMLTGAMGGGRRQVLARLRELQPDIVHAHDTYGVMVRGLNIPRVLTIHGFIHADTLVSARRIPKLRSRIWRTIEVAAWADQPHVIAISPYVRERLTGLTRAVVHDIDNPISPMFFDVTPATDPHTIFSGAVITPRKNTLGLVEALALVRRAGIPARLRLGGGAPDDAYLRKVQDRVRDLALDGAVAFLGRISTDHVKQELARAAVFALVSLEENSPLGIEEAMAAGVPVVTSNRCGMPYMVRHGEAGFLVEPDDPRQIASRLGELLSNPPLRLRFGAAARTVALDRFHPGVVARRTLDVYGEVVRSADKFRIKA